MYTLVFLIIILVFDAYVDYILKLLVTKETKPTSVNVLTTRHVSQRTTITSDPITNQSTHDFATGGVYSAIKTNSSTMGRYKVARRNQRIVNSFKGINTDLIKRLNCFHT